MTVTIKHPYNFFIYFPSCIFRRSPKLSFTDWSLYLDEIAATKKLEGGKMKEKLAACGAPGTTGATVGAGGRPAGDVGGGNFGDRETRQGRFVKSRSYPC